MKIAIYGRPFGEDFIKPMNKLISKLSAKKVSIYIYKPFYDFLKNNIGINHKFSNFFSSTEDIDKDIDIMISIGGDGTFLETVSIIKNKNIPILGINSGRLGFMANISKKELEESVDYILNNDYKIENRTLIKLSTSNGEIFDFPYALNELTVQKSESSSMITLKTFINGDFLNTYWADGLIIATPTGSTAYSLSAGGPIVMPNSDNFIITPLAPHTLTVRPLVISDNNTIKIKIKSRSKNFMVSLDYRSAIVDENVELTIVKANFTTKIIKLNSQNYFSTLRNKLMWGKDKRN